MRGLGHVGQLLRQYRHHRGALLPPLPSLLPVPVLRARLERSWQGAGRASTGAAPPAVRAGQPSAGTGASATAAADAGRGRRRGPGVRPGCLEGGRGGATPDGQPSTDPRSPQLWAVGRATAVVGRQRRRQGRPWGAPLCAGPPLLGGAVGLPAGAQEHAGHRDRLRQGTELPCTVVGAGGERGAVRKGEGAALAPAPLLAHGVPRPLCFADRLAMRMRRCAAPSQANVHIWSRGLLSGDQTAGQAREALGGWQAMPACLAMANPHAGHRHLAMCAYQLPAHACRP